MESANQRRLSIWDTLKERFSERLGEVLYRLYIQEVDPFSARHLMDDEKKR